MASLNRNIEHIVHVVQMQQSHAKSVNLQQPINAAELMEDAVRVNHSAIQQHSVKLLREYAEVPTLLLDQHSVLQILINLISNAVRAVKDAKADDKRVTLRIRANTSGESPRICFDVVDNGAGIASENLMKIFTYGFTTRKEGHGFGLHGAANAAREMGGSLAASSEGPGHGACFSLELPMKTQAERLAMMAESTGKVCV